MDENKELEVEFCLKCGEPNPVDNPICKCGNRNFIYGKNFTFKEGKSICDCGSDKFLMIIHMNLGEFHEHKYRCSNCKNKIGAQYYMGEDVL